MSAYLVNKDHIDLLCAATEWVSDSHSGFYLYSRNEPLTVDLWGIQKPSQVGMGRSISTHGGNNSDTLTAIGRELYAANMASLIARYGDTANEMADWSGSDYTWSRVDRDLVPLEVVLGAIAGYEYQACETRDWGNGQTWARDFCEKLRRDICSKIGDYQTGWSFERPANERKVVLLTDLMG